jgi:cobalt-zinc-cadmium efflux system outer membrane protein
MVATLAISPAFAEPAADEGPPPGATVDELLVLAHRLSPELAARALESDAATARAAAAGALDDPMLRITSDEDRGQHGQRLNKMIYAIEQDFPLWGKRALRRRVAEAEADGVRGQERMAVLELDARVKTAFAQSYQASRALKIQEDIHGLLHTVSQTAQARYGQGLGSQSDAIRAEVERSRLTLERERLERDQRTAQARLNALLARPPKAVLAEPAALPPVPATEKLGLDGLLEQARQRSPLIATTDAEIAAVQGGRQLVEKSWYPDISLGAAAIQRETEGVVTTGLTPQATAAYRSALVAYQSGRGDLTAVLEAAHQIQEVQLERLGAQVEQQTALAEIERIVGGTL